MSYTIEHIASWLNTNSVIKKPAQIAHLLTDSRRLIYPDTSLFFAITTGQNDGHLYVEELMQRGVFNFVVKTNFDTSAFPDVNFLKVNNVLVALQMVASHHRAQFTYPVIGITGSNGKTIVKEWLNQLLANRYHIIRSPRSYNSQIGVPLSVWEMEEKHQLAIFEAGISQKGEMDVLANIIQPTIGILTSIGTAHQEGFETESEKRNEKWKLFKKDITSLLVKESIHSNDINNQVRIMNYLSNLPSNKSNTNNDIQIGLNDEHDEYGSIQSKILSLTPEKKQQVIDIFIQYIKKNLNTLKFIKANNFNLRNIAYDKNNNLYEPESDAKNRYYYSLTQTCNYKTGAGGDFSKDLTINGYYKSANTLLESIDTLFKSSDFDSLGYPGGGGFKPRHNAITNHSKSRHNSSFKASSSKSKTKTNSRSHTQRVK